MGILLFLAGFSALCLAGAIAVLIISQRLLSRSFNMVNFVIAFIEQHFPQDDCIHPEISD